MNKLLFLMLFALAPIAMPAAEPLASFSSDGFEGWEYTRDATDVALNQNNILRKRITLFHDNDKGSDYTLLSPVMAVDGLAALEVRATLYNNNNGDSQYRPEKTSPTFELVDAQLNVVATVTVPIEEDKISYALVDILAVPAGTGSVRLRVAVWNGNVHNALAAYKVEVNACDMPAQPTRGDVNGDGLVSGADVTALYNLLLNDTPAGGNADVNGDGLVNGADVTVLYNLLLD